MNFFSGFGGGGGFPFGGGHQQDEDCTNILNLEGSGEIDNTKFYEVLEVSKDANPDLIKKQYRELAKKYHPDRPNGNAAKVKSYSCSLKKFLKLMIPYLILKNEECTISMELRDLSLMVQVLALLSSDIMNMFFGGGRGGGSRGPPQKQKTKAVKKALHVTLQQCYTGELVKLPHERTRACEECQGKGGSEVKSCKPCKGKGRVMQMYQMGPGMYQQVQKACDSCKGEGEIIEEGKKCKGCQGKKILNK